MPPTRAALQAALKSAHAAKVQAQATQKALKRHKRKVVGKAAFKDWRERKVQADRAVHLADATIKRLEARLRHPHR